MSLDAIRNLQAKQKAEREAAKAAAETEKPKGFKAKRDAAQSGGADTKIKGGNTDRDELLRMCAEVDLLALVIEDTGENPRMSGSVAHFKGTCPVCHAHDDMRVYTETNTWSCYGGHNENRDKGKKSQGGNVLDYLQYARGMTDATERVRWLREQTGHPFEPKPPKGKTAELDEDEIFNGWNDEGQDAKEDSADSGKNAESDGTDNADQDAPKLKLPEWTAIRSTDPPSRNPVLIDGVVRKGHVMLLAGKGKIGKSWSAIELCVSVATGRESWFGLPLKSSGACLYVDPELDPKSLDNRFQTVCKAMSADTEKADSLIAKWSLRGIPNASMDAIISDLQTRNAFDQFALVVIDSCSCFVEGDENKSVDVRKFAAKVLQVTRITGATVLLVHHFGKAKDGDRSAADRARGSSVWLDFPDAVLTLTEGLPPSGQPSDYLEKNEYACILESGGIREFPRMEPIRLIFGYPVHRVDTDGITESWKPTSSERDGGKKTAELNKAKKATDAAKMCAEILARFYAEGIGEEGMLAPDLAKLMDRDTRTLKEAVAGCPYLEVVQETQRKHYIRPTHAPRTSPKDEELPLEQD